MHSNIQRSAWEEDFLQARRVRQPSSSLNRAANSSRGFYRMNVSTASKNNKSSGDKKSNSQGRAAAKFDYLVREGDYEKKSSGKGSSHFEYLSREMKLDRDDDFVTSFSGNMPSWVVTPKDFWIAADQYERANGTLYREIQINFDIAFTMEQNIAMAKDYINDVIGDKHAYYVAVHSPLTLDGKHQNPHAHIIFSERIIDEVERSKEQYFKRYNPRYIERGGQRKESLYSDPKRNKVWIKEVRKQWADVQNRYARECGINKVFDERTLLEQGITHEPEKRMPLAEVNKFKNSGNSKVVLDAFKKREEKLADYQQQEKEELYNQEIVEIYQESYQYYQAEQKPNEIFKGFVSEYNSAAFKSAQEAINVINNFMRERAVIVDEYENAASQKPFINFEKSLKSDVTYVELKQDYENKISQYDNLSEDQKAHLQVEKKRLEKAMNIARKGAFERMKTNNEEAMFTRATLAHIKADNEKIVDIMLNIKSTIKENNNAPLIGVDRFKSEAAEPTFSNNKEKENKFSSENITDFIDQLTVYREKFSEKDIDKEIANLKLEKEEADALKLAVMNHESVVSDGHVYVDYWGEKNQKDTGEFFTTKSYIDEKKMLEHKVLDLSDYGKRNPLVTVEEDKPYPLMLEKMFNNHSNVFAINGVAGSGKSYAMKHYVDDLRKLERTNQVIGISLTGKAAESISSSIEADHGMTIHRFESSVASGKLWLDENTTIVIDEAGMIGTRQMNRLLNIIKQTDAKAVFLGDTEQLSSVEAGTAFNDIYAALPKKSKHSTLDIYRQHSDIHKKATMDLFQGRIGDALDIYSNEGSVHVVEKGSGNEAIEKTVMLYYRNLFNSNMDFSENLVISHKNKDVELINSAIREKLGFDKRDDVVHIATEKKDKLAIVPGEYISFEQNKRLSNGVELRNGQQATVISIKDSIITAQRGKEEINIDLSEYKSINYGYALTIHKSQGVTVNNAVLYAGNSTGNQAGYVGFTRHRKMFDAVFDESVLERPDITMDSDYFSRVSNLNNQEQKALEVLKKSLYGKVTEEDKEASNKEAKELALYEFAKEYGFEEKTEEVLEVAKDLYLNENVIKAKEALDAHVSYLYDEAKKLTKQTKGIRFKTYKEAVSEQPRIKELQEIVNEKKEAQDLVPSESNNERLIHATRNLQQAFFSDEVRQDAKNIMESHNMRVKKTFEIRDLVWSAAKNTQKEFEAKKLDFENERMQAFAERDAQSVRFDKPTNQKIVDVLWREDLVNRYVSGENYAEAHFKGEQLENIKEKGYNKLLTLQQAENPYDTPQLWRSDLVELEKAILYNAEQKGVDHEAMEALENRTRETLLEAQSKNKTLDNRKYTNASQEVER